MLQRRIPPITLTAGQRVRLQFNFTLPAGSDPPPLIGAVSVAGRRVDMVGEGEDMLVIPALPPGAYLAEVRAGGACVLYGTLDVLPSPLGGEEGERGVMFDIDLTTPVLTVQVGTVEVAHIFDPTSMKPISGKGVAAALNGLSMEAYPAGSIAWCFSDDGIPGYLPCYGLESERTVSRSTYSNLASLLGIPADDSTFILPYLPAEQLGAYTRYPYIKY